MDTNIQIRLLAFTVLPCAHQSLADPYFLPLVCNYIVHVMLVTCHIASSFNSVGERSVLNALHTSIVAETAGYVHFRS